jgi:hypothetical protein
MCNRLPQPLPSWGADVVRRSRQGAHRGAHAGARPRLRLVVMRSSRRETSRAGPSSWGPAKPRPPRPSAAEPRPLLSGPNRARDRAKRRPRWASEPCPRWGGRATARVEHRLRAPNWLWLAPSTGHARLCGHARAWSTPGWAKQCPRCDATAGSRPSRGRLPPPPPQTGQCGGNRHRPDRGPLSSHIGGGRWGHPFWTVADEDDVAAWSINSVRRLSATGSDGPNDHRLRRGW